MSAGQSARVIPCDTAAGQSQALKAAEPLPGPFPLCSEPTQVFYRPASDKRLTRSGVCSFVHPAMLLFGNMQHETFPAGHLSARFLQSAFHGVTDN